MGKRHLVYLSLMALVLSVFLTGCSGQDLYGLGFHLGDKTNSHLKAPQVYDVYGANCSGIYSAEIGPDTPYCMLLVTAVNADSVTVIRSDESWENPYSPRNLPELGITNSGTPYQLYLYRTDWLWSSSQKIPIANLPTLKSNGSIISAVRLTAADVEDFVTHTTRHPL